MHVVLTLIMQLLKFEANDIDETMQLLVDNDEKIRNEIGNEIAKF